MLDHKTESPVFIGDPKFHKGMQNLLLKKDPKHYGKMGWRVA
jgi:hypothetical protein